MSGPFLALVPKNRWIWFISNISTVDPHPLYIDCFSSIFLTVPFVIIRHKTLLCIDLHKIGTFVIRFKKIDLYSRWWVTQSAFSHYGAFDISGHAITVVYCDKCIGCCEFYFRRESWLKTNSAIYWGYLWPVNVE